VLDRAEFGQVVMNLAINARDAMPGGGRLAIAVGPVAGADGRTWAELTVADSGTGMDQETLERIFQPYFTTKEAGKGTGLGLATAQAVVERGGGSISVTSAPGQGTVFTVLLPAAQTPRKPSSQEVRAAVELSGLRVLVAEDDEVLRELVRDGLVAAGAEVCLAGDGMAAVDAVAAGFSPAVAVLDVRMPRLGGIAALAALRRRIPDLPAVLMTGYAGESHAEVRAVVASRLLAKPFAIDELLAAVRDLAGSRTAGDAQRQDLHG
jgi:CheY-like chemotaxis protein